MGFFDKLKGAVGIGQPKMELNLHSSQIRRGESIKGKITLTAGSRETPVKFFMIEHIEVVTRREWSDSQKKTVDKEHTTTVNKMQIQKNNEVLSDGKTMEEEFELPVSSAAMNSGYPYAHKLRVSADCPGLDPSKTQEIFIL